MKIGRTCERVLALDGDTKNSTYSLNYRKEFPDRHVECFVAEQNMIGVAMGLAARDRAITFSSTFAAFFTRTFDHLRMASVSQTSANFCGSHCGVSIGELKCAISTPKRDKQPISPHANFPRSKSKVLRIKEMISNRKKLLIVKKYFTTPLVPRSEETHEQFMRFLIHNEFLKD